MKTFQIVSSNGTLTADMQTGTVIDCQTDEEGNELHDITRFDVAEYKQHYGVTDIPDQLDILDLGYYYHKRGCKPEYEPPVAEWRAEFRSINN